MSKYEPPKGKLGIFDGINQSKQEMEAKSIENMEAARTEIERVNALKFEGTGQLPYKAPVFDKPKEFVLPKMAVKEVEPSDVIKKINDQHKAYQESLVYKDWQGNVVK
jgi:hypothetical protein